MSSRCMLRNLATRRAYHLTLFWKGDNKLAVDKLLTPPLHPNCSRDTVIETYSIGRWCHINFRSIHKRSLQTILHWGRLLGCKWRHLAEEAKNHALRGCWWDTVFPQMRDHLRIWNHMYKRAWLTASESLMSIGRVSKSYTKIVSGK